MRFVRLLLSITVLIGLALLPVLTRHSDTANVGSGVAQAQSIGAAAGREPAIRQATATATAAPTATATPTNNGNGNDNNGNGNSNGNGNQNDNNHNGNVNENGNDNNSASVSGSSGGGAIQPVVNVVAQCFDPQQSGPLMINLPDGAITVTVQPSATFPQETTLRLEQIDISQSPPTPGPRVGDFLFDVRAFQGCNGAETALATPVTLGLNFASQIDTSRVHVAVFQNNQWVDTPVTPDPNPANPYVSASIQATGLYTVYTLS